MMTLFRTLVLAFMAIATTSTTTTTTVSAINEQNVVAYASDITTNERNLQAFDFFDIDVDVCDNNPNSIHGDRPILGRCDTSRFPQCDERREEICYNRKPSRDEFDPINHQPVFYIQYDRVFCYPNTWGGCSSCTPGRYCVSESRCILDEVDYPCERWF